MTGQSSLCKGETLTACLGMAKEAALQSGRFLQKRQVLDIVSARGKDIKLVADLESEAIIVDLLHEKSDIQILSEERGLISKSKSDKWLMWIIDPLDGSYNYKSDIPLCCVSIALWDAGTPLLGVIYDFNRGEMFEAIAADYARLNGKRIRVSSREKPGEAVLCTGFPVRSAYNRHEVDDWAANAYRFKKTRLFGSAALSIAYVAAGRADAYQEEGIMLWDVAAGLAILVAAGGEYESVSYGDEPHCLAVRASNGCLGEK